MAVLQLRVMHLMQNSGQAEAYLEPYLRAAHVHGAGFGALLWASPDTQARRFDAIARLCEMYGRRVLDVGCGRADLLPFLIERAIFPESYRGIEAVQELAAAADRTALELNTSVRASVVLGDFVRRPALLDYPADVIVLSGSLNTIDDEEFYRTLDHLLALPERRVAFNFLSSPRLAGAQWLYWREPHSIMNYLQARCGEVELLDDYLLGDCTIAVRTASW